MADYRLDPQALEDIDRQYAYLLRRDERAADKFLDAVFDKFQQLSQHPEMGAVAQNIGDGVRCVSLPPHVIFYCLAVSDVVIRRSQV